MKQTLVERLRNLFLAFNKIAQLALSHSWNINKMRFLQHWWLLFEKILFNVFDIEHMPPKILRNFLRRREICPPWVTEYHFCLVSDVFPIWLNCVENWHLWDQFSYLFMINLSELIEHLVNMFFIRLISLKGD